jgi:4,5-dihydroxyphthalate decarboxylase
VADSARLSLVLGPYPHVAGVADGSIPVEGIAFEPFAVPSLQDAFKRMCREVCFDVCEMSITGYLLARRYGLPFTTLPVFPARGFPQSHASLVVKRGSGVTSPRDLEGRRVGARAYTGTASLWVRGVLREQYGVDLDKVTWVSAEAEHVPQYQDDAPPNVSYELGCDLPSMLASGDLAAAIGVPANDDLVQFIPDARREAGGFFKRTGIYQINHTVVMRDDVLAAHPGLADALYAAFVEAKQRWLATAERSAVAEELDLPSGDPFPYGLAANAASIEALLRYAHEQQLTNRLLTVEEAFPLSLHT